MRNLNLTSFNVKRLITQITGFCAVGFIVFGIDYVLLYVLSLCMHHMIATAIAYAVATIVSYFLTVKYVFVSNRKDKIKESVVFVILSVIGLIITEGAMYFFTDILGVYHMLSKLIGNAILMIFNFVTRKLFLDGKG